MSSRSLEVELNAPQTSAWLLSKRDNMKVKRTKIRNRYNQAPHLTQDTNGKVTTSQLDIINAQWTIVQLLKSEAASTVRSKNVSCFTQILKITQKTIQCSTNTFRTTHDFEGKRFVSSILLRFWIKIIPVLHRTAIFMLHQRLSSFSLAIIITFSYLGFHSIILHMISNIRTT